MSCPYRQKSHAYTEPSRSGKHATSFADLTHRKGLSGIPETVVTDFFELHPQQAGHDRHGATGVRTLRPMRVAPPHRPARACAPAADPPGEQEEKSRQACRDPVERIVEPSRNFAEILVFAVIADHCVERVDRPIE